MRKSMFAVAAVAAFALVEFAGAAVAAPVHVTQVVSGSHDALTMVKAKKGGSKKGSHKTSHKKTK